ncbi:DoxX family protein [Oceanobacillus sp. M60]|uniref:DoxX n=1 Tax=Oceanobacillus oncorhynchi TaxID=545501 RepID=A0A0A1MNH4_9BACI|nr:DoxX family protein [Oceanobacillus oncorhynchi]UUI39713.1 DoxX family protein [Oceanobacillus oncorhynchi]CEI80651.1 DoxX [Oceanobacillus oncorhynchi]
MMNFLRTNKYVAGLWVIIRLYLGFRWLTSGWGKIVGGEFDAGGYLQGAIAQTTGENPAVQGWWATFLETVAIPNAGLFSVFVMWGEVLVGLGLILGIFTNLAALMGVVMNFSFLLSGTFSTNPQMAILGIFIAIAGANAGRYGLDRWVMPYLKETWNQRVRKGKQPETNAA